MHLQFVYIHADSLKHLQLHCFSPKIKARSAKPQPKYPLSISIYLPVRASLKLNLLVVLHSSVLSNTMTKLILSNSNSNSNSFLTLFTIFFFVVLSLQESSCSLFKQQAFYKFQARFQEKFISPNVAPVTAPLPIHDTPKVILYLSFFHLLYTEPVRA